MRPLAVAGNVNVDLILGPAAPWPLAGTETLVAHQEFRPGGAAGNTAFAWMALGAEFQVAASVGSDFLGSWLAEPFGPHAARWNADAAITSVSVGITHPDGERTFFTGHGHLAGMDWPDVQAALDGEALAGGLLLLCGCFLTRKLSADYPLLFDWAEKRDITVALDPGWPVEGWTDEATGRARAWVGRSGHVLVNELEAKALTGMEKADDALKDLAALMPPGGVAVVKAGPVGALAQRVGGAAVRVPARPVKVVDTIGAGDVFNAGYLFALADGRSLSEALALGVDMASAAISSNPRAYTLPSLAAAEAV